MPGDNETKVSQEVKPVSIQNPQKIFFIEAFLFCLTFGLGISTAVKINKILKFEGISVAQISFWDFVFYFGVATLFILLFVYLVKPSPKKTLFFKIIFVLAVFWGGASLLSIWMSDIFSLILMMALVVWWLKKPSVFNQDLGVILGIAGISSILGLSLSPFVMIPLLVIFSIYDFVAVYKTKHMVKMAKEMVESRAVLALVVPQSLSGFKSGLAKVRPGGRFLILGGGDIAFPLLFSVSLISFGISTALIVALFGLIGLGVGFYFFASQKVRQPMPALPPIALFSIIGFLVTLIP